MTIVNGTSSQPDPARDERGGEKGGGGERMGRRGREGVGRRVFSACDKSATVPQISS